MPIQINNVPRRVVYAPTGTGGEGPYSFSFEILAAGDIAVYKDDVLLTLTTHYTVTINTNGTGSVTITSAGLALAPTSPAQYAIVGNRTIARTTDYVTGGDFFANTLNDELDQQTIFAQQNAEGLSRALQAPQTDPTTVNMTLPRKADRASKFLSFDSDGNPEAINAKTDVSTVAANINSINTVSGSIASVNTTATNIANVNTTAGSIGNVNSVGGSITNVNTVAGSISNVNSVAGNATNINAVAGNATNINAVAGNATNINAVNANSTNITTVAGISSNVTTVANISSNVTTVATNNTNVTTVATNIADVNTVAAALATPLSAASAVSYDNSVSGLAATDVQDAIDELEDEKLSLAGGTMTGQLTTPSVETEYLYVTYTNEVGSFSWNSATTSPAAVAGGPTAPVVTSIHAAMRRCLLQDNGTVNYYLDPTDSTKKADGTSSDLTGADGQVMVEIPKFYTKREVSGTITTWSIAKNPIAGFTVHPAFVKNGVEVDKRYYSAYDACFEISRTITAVADAGGGNITITATGHALYAGDVITIAGTTSYNGTFTVVTRTDANNFTVTATFVATETGTFKAYLSGLNFDNNATAGRSIGTTSATKLASISGIFPACGLTRGEFRTIAANRGTGWRQLDWTLFSAIQLLYLIEYQTFYSQSAIGNGNTRHTTLPNSDAIQTNSRANVGGLSNGNGNTTANSSSGTIDTANNGDYMSYRGIENFYGNVWDWADGCIVNPDGTASAGQGDWWFTNNSANFSDSVRTNMTQIMSNAPTGSGYVSAISGVDNFFIATSTSGGSATTYLTDQYFGSASADRVVAVGGGAASGAGAGAFRVGAPHASSDRGRNFGARLAF